MAAPDTTAAPSATPGGRATAANGSEAATRTIATITCSTIQPGSPAIVASTGGAPSIVTRARDHRDEATEHRRGHQRHDGEVDHRRHERQPAERREDVGQRRRLRRQRDPEALGQPVREPSAAEPARAAPRGDWPRRAGPPSP